MDNQPTEALTDHLWIVDGETLVCSECGLTFDDWKKGRPHVL